MAWNLEAFWVRLESVGEEHVTATVDNQLVRKDELARVARSWCCLLSKWCILTTVGEEERRAFVVCGPCDHHGGSVVD